MTLSENSICIKLAGIFFEFEASKVVPQGPPQCNLMLYVLKFDYNCFKINGARFIWPWPWSMSREYHMRKRKRKKKKKLRGRKKDER